MRRWLNRPIQIAHSGVGITADRNAAVHPIFRYKGSTLPVRLRLLVLLLFVSGCRCNDPPQTPPSEDAGVVSLTDASKASDPVGPPACEGVALSLTAAVMDARCAVSDVEWATLARAPDLARAIRPEAKLEAIAMALTFSLVNESKATVALPLRFQATRPPLSVVAEDRDHTLFELVPPTVVIDHVADAGSSGTKEDPSRARAERQDAILLDAGGAAATRVHSARVRLPPKGAITIRATLSTTIEKRIAPPCKTPDAAELCKPSALPKGHYTLHVGHFFVDLGPDLARVELDVP